MEILAPAGGLDTIQPAVRAGADAVYLGASYLSARASAKNFTREELKQAVDYCHARGVKVYLACNTLVRDEELPQAMALIEYACELPVDALIMQDIGLISLVRQAAPAMRIHGSTQMSIHTPKGAEWLWKMGLKRVVLSREMSREEIQAVREACPIELEVFVHGALCMSVSGQCYFSAMLGGRSGNRGACAQPCRLPFSVPNGTGYDLSLKDCSLLSYLRELEEMGVASAKIEGRMKRPEYTAAAVAACRQSLDSGEVDPMLLQQLEAVFSRSGFTDGYYTGRRGVSMFGVRSREDVLSATQKIYQGIHALYKDERAAVPVTARLSVQDGQASVLTVSDADGHSVSVSGDTPESALKVPLTADKCGSFIRKTGGTPFYLSDFSADIGENLSLSAGSLNALRRAALERLLQERTPRKPVAVAPAALPTVKTRLARRPKNVRARFTNGQVSDVFLDCELIYVPMTLDDATLVSLMDRGFAVAVEIPRGMFGLEERLCRRLQTIQQLGINEVLASNLGAVALAKTLDMDVHGGFGLNITNTAALEQAEQWGLLDAEVSFELTLSQIVALGGHLPIGVVAGGRLPLMLTRNDPADNAKGSRRTAFLQDRKGMHFPLQSCGSCTEVLNSVPLDMADRQKEMTGADFTVLRFSVENSVETEEIWRLFNSGIASKGSITRGLYYRGVE